MGWGEDKVDGLELVWVRTRDQGLAGLEFEPRGRGSCAGGGRCKRRANRPVKGPWQQTTSVVTAHSNTAAWHTTEHASTQHPRCATSTAQHTA